MRLIYNESEGRFISKSGRITYGIVGYNSGIYEFGYFEPQKEESVYIMCELGTYLLLKRTVNVPLYFNRITGYYTLTPVADVGFGSGNFPYSFTRYYSTRYLENMFEKYHNIDNNIQFKYMSEFPYSFGMEFETHSGYIPEDVVLKTGLIPLRDGSINGLEYSTIVLKGNDGVNTLKNMINVLKHYTIFDKECSLHMHIGGWNLKPDVLLRLNNLWATSDIANYLVPYALRTSAYKANGKDYCRMNSRFDSFQSLYISLVGKEYFGDLFQPHPSDPTGDRKWNITTRYQALNLINAVCYKHGKTAEFRCLRPSYNFDKILCWLFIFGAYIRYAEEFKLTKTYRISTENIIRSVYSAELANMLCNFLNLQRSVVEAQSSLGDMFGGRVDVEDQILTYENLSRDYKFFY